MDFYYELLGALRNTPKKSLKLSMADVHAKGLFSLVIAGTKAGELTRVFIASRKIKPFEIQLHTHRYPITLAAIKGAVVNHKARLTDNMNTIVIAC